MTVRHEFVEFIPNELHEGVMYVSIPYATVVHSCLSGCGQEVVTPLSPADWELVFDGETISLYPSIGNWSLPCRSHYWIRRNKVIWARTWSGAEINRARSMYRSNRESYFDRRLRSEPEAHPEAMPGDRKKGLWATLKGWFSRS
jgi:hypothetical protein